MLERLERLRAIDRRNAAFGARSHRYELRPPLSEAALAAHEAELGVRLPELLRRFYREVGDGGAGPGLGLGAAECWGPWVADLGTLPAGNYPGGDALEALIPDETAHLPGLLPVIYEGCTQYTCVVTTGPQAGTMVVADRDYGCVELPGTFVDLYLRWLDETLAWFLRLRDAMALGGDLGEVATRLGIDEVHIVDGIASIADRAKPIELFGSKLSGGAWAKTRPWYQDVLTSWQRGQA